MYFCGLKSRRGVAQLVARYVRDVEAGSSSLLTPTGCGAMHGIAPFFCDVASDDIEYLLQCMSAKRTFRLTIVA